MRRNNDGDAIGIKLVVDGVVDPKLCAHLVVKCWVCSLCGVAHATFSESTLVLVAGRGLSRPRHDHGHDVDRANDLTALMSLFIVFNGW